MRLHTCLPWLLLGPASALAQTTPPAPAMPHVLLVWGGGKERAEAEASLKGYTSRADEWKEELKLAEGYPRIVPSESIPGLKPGFQVVVLGACAPAEAEPLASFFDTVDPRSYTREVQWRQPGALPCPSFIEGWSYAGSARAQGKRGELHAAHLSFSETEGEVERRGWTLILSAFDKRGKLLASSAETSLGDFSDVTGLEASGAKLVLREREVDPACHGSASFKVVERTWRYSLGEAGGVDSESSEKVVETGPCDYPELGADSAYGDFHPDMLGPPDSEEE